MTWTRCQRICRISTHTLTWSVTRLALTLKSENLNFNSHAHVERDRACKPCSERCYYFNSHAHVERDRRNLCRILQGKISTHTLTWSVTIENATKLITGAISTHTLTWSVTLDVVYIWCLLNVMRTYFFI